MALTANFIADFSSFMDATRDATTAMGGLKDSAADVGPATDASFKDLASKAMEVGGAVQQVGASMAGAASGFIAAFSEEQDAVNKLNTALKTTGDFTPTVVAQYEDLAAQFEKTTKYADDAIIGVQATLTTIGTVGPENMELALTAVTNLASGMGIDLKTATMMVAKAFSTGGEELGKLKVILGDTLEPGLDAAGMLNAINDKFGPAAQADLQTYSGQMAALENKFGALEEQVGGVLIGLLTDAMNMFTALPEPVQQVTVAIGMIGSAIAPVLVSLSSLISIIGATGIGAAMMSALTGIVALLTGPIGIGIAIAAVAVLIYKNWDAIVDYTAKLYNGIKSYLVDGFGAIVENMKQKVYAVIGFFRDMWAAVVGHSYVPDMIDGIGSEFGQLDAVMVQPVQDATAASIRAYAELQQYTNRANAILQRNKYWTTPSQLEEIANLPVPGSGGGGGGPITVNNTFNMVDTQANLARAVSEEIMRTIRAGTQLGTA